MVSSVDCRAYSYMERVAAESRLRQAQGESAAAAESSSANTNKKAPGELNDEEKRQVQKLKETDRKVRQHEMAHQTAGAGLVKSGAQFEYKRGPDGQMYAVGGEVQIDTSEVRGDPQATLAKAERIRQAALAPADPSAQDRQVAAQATQMAARARMELARQKTSPDQAQGANGPATSSRSHFAAQLSVYAPTTTPTPGSLFNVTA